MRGTKPALKAVDGGLLKAPPAPRHLPDDIKPEWRTIAADLTGRGLLTSSMLPVLERFVMAIALARKFEAAILEHGALIPAADGQLKAKPAIAANAKNVLLMARLADELGLSPLGRSRPAIRAAEEAADAENSAFAAFDI